VDDNRIHVDLKTTRDEFEGRDHLDVEVAFEIPVASRTRPVALFGIALHVIGLLLFIIMAALLILSGPTVWFAWDGDLAASQTLKERVGITGMLGITFLLSGLALYTYGRTVRGGEDLTSEGVAPVV
jgi:heme/copper-type cytochrome/quinol oxidase subunit 3